MKHIPISDPILEGKELDYLTECVRTGWISSQGEFVKQFESQMAQYCNCKHGVSTSSGTTALHLALAALNVGEGDEVIIPSFTFVAVGNVVAHTGAKPIFVDIEKDTWNIDPEKIEDKITEKTKAIMFVHTYGHPCELDKIIEIAKKHNLFLIENAAEAQGAEFKGGKVGSFGDISCFSFFANKIMTTGEGGMCLTNNFELDKKMRVLRDHGLPPLPKHAHERYRAEVVGYNYRMTNMQAAIGCAQLEKVGDFIEQKIENSKYIANLLKDVAGITLPVQKEYAKNVYWLYTIMIEDSFPLTRDLLILRLKEHGIDSRPVYYPLNEMPPFHDGHIIPITHDLSKKGINLPSSPKLTKEDMQRIVDVIKKSSRDTAH